MAKIIEATDGDEVAYWDGMWWIDDPLEAQIYGDDLDDALIEAERAGRPDQMQRATIDAVDASAALALRSAP